MTNGGTSAPVDPTGRFELADGVLTRKVGGEILLLDTTTEQYFSLNEVGADLLSLIDDGSSVQTAIAALIESYDAPADRITNDIEGLMRTLVERGLLVPRG